jgi:hypothetical protein
MKRQQHFWKFVAVARVLVKRGWHIHDLDIARSRRIRLDGRDWTLKVEIDRKSVV